jgi:hypothetical protein
MTIYIWDPVGGYSKGTAKHISTQGFKPTNHPLTVSTQGYIIPEFADVHITLDGAADVILQVPSVYSGQGIIYVDGAVAPVVVELDSISTFEYDPIGTIDVSGDALYVFDVNGNVVYDYTSTGSELDGGLIFTGDGAIEFVPGTGLVPERGGRGVVRTLRKTKIFVPNIYIWHAPLLRRFALKLSGEATTEFAPSENFAFIKSLASIPIVREPEQPDFIRAINNYIQLTPKAYEEIANASPSAFSGDATCEFAASKHTPHVRDDDMIVLAALEGSPVIVTLSDSKYNQIRKEDEMLLELL